MTWTPAERYTVKLEGVEMAGYRAIAICGTRDPILPRFAGGETDDEEAALQAEAPAAWVQRAWACSASC